MGAVAAYGAFMGPALNLTRWRHTIQFHGISQEITWGFPLGAILALGFAVFAGAICAERRAGDRAFGSLLSLRDAGVVLVAIFPIAVLSFMLARPANFSIGMVVTAFAIAAFLQVSGRLIAMAIRVSRGTVTLAAEARTSPNTVKISLIFASLAIGILLIEAALRVYNPFGFRIRGSQIVLQTNYRFVIENAADGKLEPEVIHTRNALGFRGSDPSSDLDRYLSVVAVGGSTTEEYYISDSRTWVATFERRLSGQFERLWVNNAGLMGHTTRGHLVLMNDYLARLRPKVILLLVGINDLAVDTQNPHSALIDKFESDIDRQRNQVRPFLERLGDFSEVADLANNVLRRHQAAATVSPYRLRLTGDIEFSPIHPPDPEGLEVVREFLGGAPLAYEKRLRRLIAATRAIGALPILITQPLLWGEGKDPRTGANLATVQESLAQRVTTSLVLWQVLEDFNTVTRGVGQDLGLPVVDLARLLPKDSRYFMDKMHFSPEGSGVVGGLVADHVCGPLKAAFPAYASAQACPGMTDDASRLSVR